MKLPVLEHAQQFGLQRERHVSDLVQEDRASIRHLQFALLQSIRAGEGTAFMPEEFVFKQRFRQGDTVDDHQGHGLTQTPLMNRTGEEFLARAAFTEQ